MIIARKNQNTPFQAKSLLNYWAANRVVTFAFLKSAVQKNTLFFLASVTLFLLGNYKNAFAQQYKSKRPSPPKTVTQEFKGGNVTIDYSSPAVKWRKIWNGLVPYGEVWRTGANEATVITFDKAVRIEGHHLPVGKYALFTIPEDDKWIIIFNAQHKQWGAFKYNKKDDVLRIKVKSGTTKTHTERLLFEITKRTPEKGTVKLFWEKMKIAFDFELDK